MPRNYRTYDRYGRSGGRRGGFGFDGIGIGVGGPFLGGLAGGLLGSVLFPGESYGRYPVYPGYPYYPYGYSQYNYPTYYPPYGYPPNIYYRPY